MKSNLPKLILVGGGNGNIYAPWDGERWGVNATCLGHPVHMSFHLHDLEHQEKYFITGTNKEKQANFEPFLAYVKMTNHPVLSIKEYPGLPSVKRYPYEEIVDYFQTDFFSNSYCYMIAYAIWKGYRNIESYGFNFLMAGEYQEELPGVHYWLGIAQAMGLRMGKEFKVIGNMSKLFYSENWLNYGFEQPISHKPIGVALNIRPATDTEIQECLPA